MNICTWNYCLVFAVVTQICTLGGVISGSHSAPQPSPFYKLPGVGRPASYCLRQEEQNFNGCLQTIFSYKGKFNQ